MPEVITCSECDRKLRVPDEMLGKKVKCPGCGTIFVARVAAPEPPRPAGPSGNSSRPSDAIEPAPLPPKRSPPRLENDEEEDRPRRRARNEDEEDDDRPRRRVRRDEEDEDDEDRPRRRARDDDEDDEVSEESIQGWRGVRTGLTLMLIAIFTSLGAVVLLPILACAMLGAGFGTLFGAGASGNQAQMQSAASGFEMGVYIFIGVASLFGLAIGGLQLAGVGYHLNAPEQRGVRLKGLALITFILFCCAFGIPLILLGLTFIVSEARMVQGPVSILLIVSSHIAFLLLLKGVCQSLGSNGLAAQANAFFITYASIAGIYILLAAAAIAMLGVSVLNIGPGGNPNLSAAGGAAGGLGIIGGVSVCFLPVVVLGLFVWFIVFLFQVRGDVDRYLRRR